MNTRPIMPPGYKLQESCGRFRFVNIGNGHTSDTYGTASYAAKLAWHVYNSQLKDEETERAGWEDLAP